MSELHDYLKFSGPARLNKAVNMLHGLVAGIRADEGVQPEELNELAAWCTLHNDLRSRQPFEELIPLIEHVLADGKIDEEERADLLWACERAGGFCDYYDDIAGSIQYLNGLAHGLLADRVLSETEIKALHAWLVDNEFLCGTYPFDEIYSIASSILADGRVTEAERAAMTAALGDLVDFRTSRNLSESDFGELKTKYTLPGICAICPPVSFAGKVFVISGDSARATREEITDKIVSLGGTVRSGVSSRTDFLIVGSKGNPCWAFACYGRKIETAMNLRKAGGKVLILNEADFWDAVQDAEAGIVV